MTIKRFFYYGPFCFTTGAVQASGLGYIGKDKVGNDDWNRVIGSYVLKLETETSAI
jgi:hypothetical protein